MYVIYVMFVQCFELQGRHFTNFHYYYYYYKACECDATLPWFPFKLCFLLLVYKLTLRAKWVNFAVLRQMGERRAPWTPVRKVRGQFPMYQTPVTSSTEPQNPTNSPLQLPAPSQGSRHVRALPPETLRWPPWRRTRHFWTNVAGLWFKVTWFKVRVFRCWVKIIRVRASLSWECQGYTSCLGMSSRIAWEVSVPSAFPPQAPRTGSCRGKASTGPWVPWGWWLDPGCQGLPSPRCSTWTRPVWVSETWCTTWSRRDPCRPTSYPVVVVVVVVVCCIIRGSWWVPGMPSTQGCPCTSQSPWGKLRACNSSARQGRLRAASPRRGWWWKVRRCTAERRTWSTAPARGANPTTPSAWRQGPSNLAGLKRSCRPSRARRAAWCPSHNRSSSWRCTMSGSDPPTYRPTAAASSALTLWRPGFDPCTPWGTQPQPERGSAWRHRRTAQTCRSATVLPSRHLCCHRTLGSMDAGQRGLWAPTPHPWKWIRPLQLQGWLFCFVHPQY